MNVLVVDENVAARNLLRAALESGGHEVSEAVGGEEALVLLSRLALDVIVSDILMPGMDGYRLCREVRRGERWSRTAFLFHLPAWASAEDEALCFDLGADAVLRQPASAAQLASALEAAAGRADRPVQRPGRPNADAAIKESLERLVTRLKEANAELAARVGRLEAAVRAEPRRALPEMNPAEQALREERGFSDAAFGSLPGVLYLYDEKGRFLRWNQNFERVTGYDADEIAAMHPLDFFRGADRDLIAERIKGVFEIGRLDVEADFVSKDGRATPYYFTGVRIQFDGQTCLVGVGIDISERRRAEENRRVLLDRLQIAAQAAQAGIWELDLVDDKAMWDDQMFSLLGVEPGSVKEGAARWSDVMHPDDIAVGKSILDEALQQGRDSFDIEFRIVRPSDGAGRIIRSTGIIKRDAGGAAARMIGSIQDVTLEREREGMLAKALVHEKQLVSEAQSGNRAKSEFLAVMSHEIRTPMNGILGFADLLAATPGLPGDCRDYVRTIASSGEALLRILDDILDFSRIEAGGLKIDKSLFSPRDILQDIHALLAPHATHKGLEFRVAIGGDVPARLWNDAGRLRQVLLNLAGNALKFTVKGSIVLGVQPSPERSRDGGDGVDFWVRDTGPGIPGEKLGRIFDPFTQVDSSISRRYGGTGLGLSISQSLVELMGGRLAASSTPGEGSEFRVTLPADAPKEAWPAGAESGGETLDETFAAAHPLNILLVEDDPTNCKLMRMVLRKLGYDPHIAQDGVEAVEIYQRVQPSCVLMDLQMPRKDGLQATIEIREIESAAKVARRTFISALTANIVAEDRRQCFVAGMDSYMNKPVKRALLARTLAQAAHAHAG